MKQFTECCLYSEKNNATGESTVDTNKKPSTIFSFRNYISTNSDPGKRRGDAQQKAH